MTEATSNTGLAGKKILVGVTGGIAAYKACELVRLLTGAGADVHVVMTATAREFVGPLTFQALSGRPVRTDLYDLSSTSDPQHISLTERADLMLVAPATSTLLAKVAVGLCDDLVSLMIAASACPVVFAPAMNVRMWEHPIAQENYAKLAGLGYGFIGPEEGWLACRNVGAGRLSEPARIVADVTRMLTEPGALPPRVGLLEDATADDEDDS
jgi:phosphopantothenoylcysteine decarboxylase/phosphopantothenate--cysteine ligase